MELSDDQEPPLGHDWEAFRSWVTSQSQKFPNPREPPLKPMDPPEAFLEPNMPRIFQDSTKYTKEYVKNILIIYPEYATGEIRGH